MLFKFSLPLLNLYLTYLETILRIPLLKFSYKQNKFIKLGVFSVPKSCMALSTGVCFIVNSFFTLVFIPLSQVEKMFVSLFTIGMIVSLISFRSMLVYLDDFISLLNILLGLDARFGKFFPGN